MINDTSVRSIVCKNCHLAKSDHVLNKCLFMPTQYTAHTCKGCGRGFIREIWYEDTRGDTDYHPHCLYISYDTR